MKLRKVMISVEEAVEKILSFIETLEPEEKPILNCLGQVLAEDIYSRINIPPADNSAMDGYAVRAEDTRGVGKASPVVLPVVDEVAAGYVARKRLDSGTSIRIMTGAPLPEGADAVVPFEDTDEMEHRLPLGELSRIGVLREVRPGANVRFRGEDIKEGARALEKGIELRPAEIGVLASLGYVSAPVIRRPVVSILATGDELVEVDQALTAGKIHNSNTYTVAAEVIRYGGIPMILGVGGDSVESLDEKIDQSLVSDMLITSGGVSLGNYDVVKDVLMKRGEIALWTICMKPGKPSAFGMIDSDGRRLPHLGLPGNPVSTMIAFEQFARPAILKMMGKKAFAKPSVEAIIDDAVKNTDGRRIYTRVAVVRRKGKYHACLTGPQGSGILSSMVKANGLAIIPENTPGVKAGDRVRVQMLNWSEDSIMEE
ncbi:MAG: molybdopterin molybdotransferase MoeA [Dehalococcoidia bacterium]|nr:molybdopterin molybdotransferase MoeA [Dehalococcoidia bacterium]